ISRTPKSAAVGTRALTLGRGAVHYLLPRLIRSAPLSFAFTLVHSSILPVPASAQGPTPARTGDDPIFLPGAQMPTFDEATEEILQQRDIAFITRRTAGDNPLSEHDAAKARAAAAKAADQLKKKGAPPSGPATFVANWAALGPNPIVSGLRPPWRQVSGDFFVAVSVSRLIVDPANPNHLYATVLRGRGGARRTTPPIHSRFGIWESKDGAVTWTLLKEAVSQANGATDIEMDPQ